MEYLAVIIAASLMVGATVAIHAASKRRAIKRRLREAVAEVQDRD